MTKDVTVITAVYNTMPYLRDTLESLANQSIGHSRLQVVAVDDGSTDQSGDLLDEYAERFPAVFSVIHQANSGGPAGPSNQGLDAAVGRWVYFLGADDYLGLEALERMVDYGDEHGSDIVLGKVVGVGGRGIRQRLYQRNQPEVDRYGPELRWNLANTFLYRRDLVERLGLRYREGLPFGSDQPFMLEAVVNASRVSVLGEYTCYYAVDRHDRTNITYSTPYHERLRCIEVLVSTAARLLPEGAPRDTVLVRHFSFEVPSVMKQGFAELPPSEHAKVCGDVLDLVHRYCSPATHAELGVLSKVLFALAERGDTETIAAVVASADEEPAPLHVTASGVYAGYPGFEPAAPDEAYRVPAQQGFRDRLAGSLRCFSAGWIGRGPSRRLWVDLSTTLMDPTAAARVDAVLRRPGETVYADEVTLVGEPRGLSVLVQVDVRDLNAMPEDGPPWTMRLTVSVADWTVDVPVPLPDELDTAPVRLPTLTGVRVASLARTQRPPGLALRTHDVPTSQVVRAVARRLRPGKRG